jgi:hypothetical protein
VLTTADTWELWTRRARLIRVTDGDTVVMEWDQGAGDRHEEAIRLINDWAPESTQAGYVETTTFTSNWFRSVLTGTRRRWPFVVQTVPSTAFEPNLKRSFTRYLGLIYEFENPANCLNDQITAFLLQHPEWGRGTT